MYKAVLENVEYELYNKIVKYSMHNANSTLGENVRYFMYKYNSICLLVSNTFNSSLHTFIHVLTCLHPKLQYM